jgi:predicted choloylglycine hydrolase
MMNSMFGIKMALEHRASPYGGVYRPFRAILYLPLLFLCSCGTAKLKRFSLDYSAPIIQKSSSSSFSSGENSLKKNPYKQWELYVEGGSLERGLLNGALSDSIYRHQEKVFFKKVEDLVPSKGKQRFLRNFLAWYNRKLPKNIIQEYKEEIYGLSRYSSDSLDFIALKYARNLYLHGAHDIGHAIQDLALVGCTSFAVWGENTEDGELLIGRNFDFYAGDDFAENKVIALVKPQTGYAFLSVTWPGMIGVVSGMNTEGLTVTINAGKSSIPLKAKTPVSLLTREILQYAKNIDEAIAIARKRKVFVSESIMVGSANDNKAILIEISPKKMDIFEVENSGKLVCSNHFQSAAFRKDKKNKKHIEESHSQYRFDRMTELLSIEPKMNVERAVSILRNKEGLQGKPIGLGNEKALNQLLAHHGVVFKPKERKVWVSANPYQLGAFVAYDLKEIFSGKSSEFFFSKSESIPQDDFLDTELYRNYERFRVLDREIDKVLKEKGILEDGFIEEYITLNPDFWIVYYKSGRYFEIHKQVVLAKEYYRMALAKEITTLPAKKEIEKRLNRLSD